MNSISSPIPFIISSSKSYNRSYNKNAKQTHQHNILQIFVPFFSLFYFLFISSSFKSQTPAIRKIMHQRPKREKRRNERDEMRRQQQRKKIQSGKVSLSLFKLNKQRVFFCIIFHYCVAA